MYKYVGDQIIFLYYNIIIYKNSNIEDLEWKMLSSILDFEKEWLLIGMD